MICLMRLSKPVFLTLEQKRLKRSADKYEKLLKRFRNKEEMTDFEQAEILIIINQVITSMESQRTKLTKAINGMKDIKLKL